MTTNPTPLPVPTQWTLTTRSGASIPTPIEASLAAETLGIHVHNRDDLPMQLDPTTWMLDTPHVVVVELANSGELAISNNAYEADAVWPDHVAAPAPTFGGPLEALRHHVSGAVDRGEAEAIVEVGVDRCPACGEPIDYCQGHGEIGDPAGFEVLECHDRGDHTDCHPNGCENSGEYLDDTRPPLLSEGYRERIATRILEHVQEVFDGVTERWSDADIEAVLRSMVPTPIPEVWVVEQVTHGDHPTDESGESCDDECIGELALSTWYPSQYRACAVADELQRQTWTSHRASLLVLDPENPTL